VRSGFCRTIFFSRRAPRARDGIFRATARCCKNPYFSSLFARLRAARFSARKRALRDERAADWARGAAQASRRKRRFSRVKRKNLLAESMEMLRMTA
jgi:hypothetical protein